MLQRLQKFLAQAGFGSRRNCEKLILQGKVKVNNKVITKLGTCVDFYKDSIFIENRKISSPQQLVYLILNKPAGYLTTLYDPQRRPCVKDLILAVKERVYPAGRLDQDAEGLILLSNDGELVYKITHPNFKVEKTYNVKVNGICSESDLNKLRRTIKLDDKTIAPTKIRILRTDKGFTPHHKLAQCSFSQGETHGAGFTLLEVKIFQGIKHQIKKMFKLIGYDVVKLKRIKIGNLILGNLLPGKWRYLSAQEINKLKGLLETTKNEVKIR